MALKRKVYIYIYSFIYCAAAAAAKTDPVCTIGFTQFFNCSMKI